MHLTRPAQRVLGQVEAQVWLFGLGRAIEEIQGKRFCLDRGGFERDVELGVETDADAVRCGIKQLRLLDGQRGVVEGSLGNGWDAYFEAVWSVFILLAH